MIPKYDKVHNQFRFNGVHFNHSELKEVAYSLIKEGETYEKITGNFLLDWLNDDDFLIVNTSGSTGKPKPITLKKQAMVNSAIATGDFFGLNPGDRALHCLPSHYIAGKMMFVRALVLGLKIDFVEPTSQPIFDYEKPYDFCAMVPLQLNNTISYVHNIKTIIVGGSKVGGHLIKKISESTSSFFETYGMTETVTHVAVKQLKSANSEGETHFKALPNVIFKKDKRDCLVINAPKLLHGDLTTNDIVDLKSETSFKLLGRYDNVINSGGIKLFPEQIEAKLQSVVNERFIIAGESDKDLGERLVLIVENPKDSIERIASGIKRLKDLTKFEIPKAIYTTNNFIETASGKINRKKTISNVLG